VSRLSIAAIAVLGLGLAGCATDPYYSDAYYSDPYAAGNRYYGPAPARYQGTGELPRYADARVVDIQVVRGSGGRTSGGGAVAGAIVGGVLGHQVGSGRGNDVATVAGALGGALAGNEIERRRDPDDYYRVTVEFPDRRIATFSQDSLHGVRIGDRVRIAGNRVMLP
jgi:outer membrane lipoprotein SlyB